MIYIRKQRRDRRLLFEKQVLSQVMPQSPKKDVKVKIGMAHRDISVVIWSPTAPHEQWGALLRIAGTDLAPEDYQKVLASFRGEYPLNVISTRYGGPSFEAARVAKSEAEHGRLPYVPMGPTFNPNEDNINIDPSSKESDQHSRDQRWLLVWQMMATQAAESGGCMIQVLDEAEGMSDMQKAEELIANHATLKIIRVTVADLYDAKAFSGIEETAFARA